MKKELNKVKIFFDKYPYIIPVAIIIFCMFLAVSFRLNTLSLPITDRWAESTVYNSIQQQVSQDVISQNPLLSDAQKQNLIQQQTQQFIESNRAEYEKQVKSLSQNYRAEFQMDDGQTYFVAIDPFYFYRFYRNIIETGQPGEYMRDGRSYTKLMTAPTEIDVTNRADEFHVYFSIWIYKTVNFFNKDISPYFIFFIIPAIFAGLSVIPAFLIGKRLGGNIGGLMTSIYILLHTSVMSRTVAGFSDTDIYNIFFPLLLTYFTLITIQAKTKKKALIFSFITAITAVIYSTAWIGWWFMFSFIIAAFIMKIFFDLIISWTELKRKKAKTALHHFWEKSKLSIYSLGIFVVSTIMFFIAIGGNIMSLIRLPLSFITVNKIQEATNPNLWPNVFTTVAELNPGSFNDVIRGIGMGNQQLGLALFIFALIGIGLMWWTKGSKSYRITKMVFFALWLFATIYATFKGIRFMIMVATPIGILLGIFFGLGSKKLSEISAKLMEIPRIAIYSILIAIIILAFIGTKPFIGVGNTGVFVNGAAEQLQVPSMNDDWYNTLIKIRDNSNESAIISSWWDFGHQFITVSERGATADGAHQNKPQAHWLGKLFLTNNDRESVGILRMLNCDANKAYDKINEITNDAVESIDHLGDLTKVNEDDAKVYLQENNFSDEQADDILKSTHCDAPESFVITSEDMGCLNQGEQCRGKTGVWAHFGGWNFTKAKLWNIVSSNSRANAQSLLVEEGFVDNENDARTIVSQLKSFNQDQANAWISPWPGYYSPMISCNEKDNTTLSCTNGVTMNIETRDIKVPTQTGLSNPKSIVYIDDEGTYTIEEKGGDEISVIIIKRNNKYYIMYASWNIAESVFTRLFYLNDGGEYFNKFNDVTDVTGQRIITWKVDWESVYGN